MGNDTALSIPLAIDAGLGELGRNGLLITPEYGACVRLCKVFTDLPLEADRPVEFGLAEICQRCRRLRRGLRGRGHLVRSRAILRDRLPIQQPGYSALGGQRGQVLFILGAQRRVLLHLHRRVPVYKVKSATENTKDAKGF